jgi:hypothetical protein
MPRLRDKTRFQKQYPARRQEPQYELVVDAAELKTVETALITFSNEETKTYAFGVSFSATPIVVVTPADSSVPSDGQVNLYLSAVSRTLVTIKSSAPFTGTASLIAVSST